MRNLGKKERLLECVKGLHRDTLEILQMDVTDQQSILDAKERVVEKRVDILGKPSRVQTASFEMIIYDLTGRFPLFQCVTQVWV